MCKYLLDFAGRIASFRRPRHRRNRRLLAYSRRHLRCRHRR